MRRKTKEEIMDALSSANSKQQVLESDIVGCIVDIESKGKKDLIPRLKEKIHELIEIDQRIDVLRWVVGLDSDME